MKDIRYLAIFSLVVTSALSVAKEVTLFLNSVHNKTEYVVLFTHRYGQEAFTFLPGEKKIVNKRMEQSSLFTWEKSPLFAWLPKKSLYFVQHIKPGCVLPDESKVYLHIQIIEQYLRHYKVEMFVGDDVSTPSQKEIFFEETLSPESLFASGVEMVLDIDITNNLHDQSNDIVLGVYVHCTPRFVEK